MEKFSTITREELKKKMNEGGDFVLIDVLGAMSYAERHLPGAISIPGNDENFVAEAEKALGGDKSKEVIVYCGSFSCQASPAAAGKLAEDLQMLWILKEVLRTGKKRGILLKVNRYR